MIDTSVKYMGLTLKNPIIIGSCGLTNQVDSLIELERNGAGAVVLKSIFEEQIMRQTAHEWEQIQQDSLLYSQMSETLDYADMHIRDKNLVDYLQLIKQAKKTLLIPVIASVNCVSSQQWVSFVKAIEQAGADAIELNIFVNTADESDVDVEQLYIDIIRAVKKNTLIPVSVKMGSSFTKLAKTIKKIGQSGVDALVLFNRFYTPDFNIDTQEIITSNRFSHDMEYTLPLKWIALTAGDIPCDLVATTGIHSGEAIIKQLLAGASAVQISSIIYEKGPSYIHQLVSDLEAWMEKHGYHSIDQFKGNLKATPETQEAFERIQYMRYFGKVK